VAGQESIEGNKMADELAKSEPEAACGISAGTVRERTNWDHGGHHEGPKHVVRSMQ
jgi:hypothetical protein